MEEKQRVKQQSNQFNNQNPPLEHLQRQQVCMSPQNENLQYMYHLIETLRNQLIENRDQKNSILKSIGTLSTRLERDPERKRESNEKDIIIFKEFLARNKTGQGSQPIPKCEEDRTKYLALQNKHLRELLGKKTLETEASLQLLNHHESMFAEVVKHLREDIANFHSMVRLQVKSGIGNKLLPLEDEEFKIYLENTEDLQKLFELSKLYRALLKLL
ncbi:Far7p KNAG_0B05430 [Huiozyma naganishii CBS 8797]|uniref:Factor arrest protein 7 n=1 Tax=Huiozyma naganishii (strain ATCC MYA-139 / BCRC 22969 / CBS 8797 / KCTC 17520 / NBRC 10181 / NCYC 3082 / Yp74L-3) TaxID=1071383 RepID=J7S575_HUIN7|nr:hypothetical protein KNAG_0B05430 [Kazachstania naganishii CBS 8797]CCK68976.1 hypothetical protein KNAG_0B05430 [Kazachstania naganishii CBS 8797]